jgi:NAD(P)-dependent dehydrogenase (short-subunit alcohol dehydrogenase family)
MGASLRTVVITGSSTGIGEAAALRLDAGGWRVVAGVRREADGRALAARASDRLSWIHLDVTDEASIRSAASEVDRLVDGRGLGGLVNNAGIAVGGPLEYLPMQDLRRQFEVNVFGLVAVTQAFLPLLRTGSGRIVNVGSIGGRITTPFVGPYCASKHAVEALSDALRMELKPWGLEVSVIEPGVVATPIWEKGVRDFNRTTGALSPEAARRYGGMIAGFGRILHGSARRGIPADRVARAIEHALTARRPRVRYLLGRDARLRLLLQQVLPRRWYDALVLAMLRRLGAGASG